MLKIDDLTVATGQRLVLKDINIILEKGKVYGLVGPNGSGKTSLALTLAGHPKYLIEKGRLTFLGKNLKNLKPEERAKLGIFVSFQAPVAISGISLGSFFRTISKDKAKSIGEFKGELKASFKGIGLAEAMVDRDLNVGFSGGEKKRVELLSLLYRRPKLAVLDEIDSGLDKEGLKKTTEILRKLVKRGTTILLVSHHQKIFDYLKPEKIFQIKNGTII